MAMGQRLECSKRLSQVDGRGRPVPASNLSNRLRIMRRHVLGWAGIEYSYERAQIISKVRRLGQAARVRAESPL